MKIEKLDVSNVIEYTKLNLDLIQYHNISNFNISLDISYLSTKIFDKA